MSTPFQGAWQANDPQFSKTEVDRPEEKIVEFTIRKNGTTVSAGVPLAYFEAHVLPVITDILREFNTSPSAEPNSDDPAEKEAESESGVAISVKTIAQRLSARTASEVMKAAAISLAVVQKREKFTIEELLNEVRNATGYWRKTHSINEKYVLDVLTSSGLLVEAFDGRYSLSPAEEAKAARMFA